MPEQSERKTIIGYLTIAILLCAVCSTIAVSSAARIIELNLAELGPTPEPRAGAAPLTPTPVRLNRTDLPADFTPETETQLAATELPIRDLRALASRLKYHGRELPVTLDQPTSHVLGDIVTFWVVDDTGPSPRQFQVDAEVKYITEHAYWWVEVGRSIDQDDLQRSAEIFENQTYPKNRAIFGSEWQPGVDQDPRISIFLGHVPGVGGYYASLHEFTPEVNPYSNVKEMFFINLNALKPGADAFDSTLAHEFQHMIHWYQDRNEDTWVNEGMSELAAHLNGYSLGRAKNLYLNHPDLQLNTWGNSPGESLPHYGSSFLFMAYLHQIFDDTLIRDIIAETGDGIAGINNTLANQGIAREFDDIFADFIVANYLNDPDLDQGQWGYQNLNLPQVAVEKKYNRYPAQAETTVNQYGVDYIELRSDGPLQFNFTGSTNVRLINNDAYSSRYQWYSNRGDDSMTSLTRAFDLSQVTQATLQYQTWYDIEEDWDYAYLEISLDQGQSWQILKTPGSRETNPSGNAYGPGYTGVSSGWLQETVDLAAYAGQEILLRFEYITDDAVNAPGFALDDIAIPEIDFFDDAENDEAGWQAEGFIRIDNLLRQRFILQVIDLQGTPTVTRLPLTPDNTISLNLGAPGEALHLVLVISAQAPVTTEAATYQYMIDQVR